MWSLILLQLSVGHGIFTVDSSIVGNYNSMYDCFQEREQIVFEMNYIAGSGNDPRLSGNPPPNTQLVCIKVNEDEKDY